MLLYRIIFTLLVTICIVHVSAQQYRVSDISKDLLSRANAVIQEEHISFELDYSNAFQTVHRVITILNKAGEKHAELVLYYDKSKTIKDIKGQILDEFGNQINKFNQKDFKDYSATSQVSMFDDIRVKHYTPNFHTYPYTIVYSYELKHTHNLFIPYWQPNYLPDLAIISSTYELNCKSDQLLRIKSENIPQPAHITTTEKSKTYRWIAKNIKARKEEPLKPFEQQDAILVKVVPETFHYFKKKGTVKNWSDFGKWVHENLLTGKQELSPETKDKVRELTAHLDSNKEKAKVLYAYMQHKTRYVSIQIGIGGLEPYPASYVDQLGYGDCKALVNYTQALLKEAGIESLYCIVEAGHQKKNLDIDFANAVDGNHIILCLPFEKDTTWLECTSNKHPFGYLGKFTDDRLVLACTPDGGKILRTTRYPFTRNLQHRVGDFKVTKTGSIQGSITTTFTGTQFDNHFENVSKGQHEQQELLKQFYDIDNISFSNNVYEVNTQTESTVNEQTDITIKNYVVKNKDQLIFSPNLFNLAKAIPESKNRTNPLYINRGYTDIDSITYSIQEQIKGSFHPINKVIDSPMGTYDLQITMKDDQLIFYRKLEIREGTYQPESYVQFYNFMREVSETDRGKFTLRLATD